MKKAIKRLLFIAFSLVILINLSGCAKLYRDGNLQDIYPINTKYFWDRFFIQPIAWLLDLFTTKTGSYALGILITTIIVRTILTPIYTKSNDMSIKMNKIQPEIQKIQQKYAGKTDPDSRNRMQQEMMKLYKDNNINMFAGCLMPFLQMPVFLAMYNAVVKTPVTYNYSLSVTNMLGIDLSKPGPIYFLPVIVGITAYLLQYISTFGMSEEAKNNPTIKTMNWMMPGMMFVFAFSQSSALSLYWIVGNIYSTLQIIVVKKPFKRKDKDGEDKPKKIKAKPIKNPLIKD